MWRVGTHRLRWLVAVALACLLAFSVGTSASTAEESAPVTLRATFATFPDYLDPQLSYTGEGWTAMWDTYIPLLTLRHASGRAGADIIPGLARGLPKVTDGGRTYTLYLRKGLKYSDGTPVRASDFEYTVKRAFKVFSPGAPFFTVIAGARRFWRTGRGGIGGIVADDRTGRIVIHLSRPCGSFEARLAIPFTALVPSGTPMHDLSANPPPATGPYAITTSKPGIGWTYARNPAWQGGNEQLLPQLPSGHVDRITVRVVRNGSAQVKGVLAGTFDWMENQPPASWLGVLREKHRSQLHLEQTLSTYFFWMNTTKAPFDDVRVRRAVNYAINPGALRRFYAGQMAPTQQILPPGMPGYRKFVLYPHDMRRARQLVAAAHPSDRKITVWTSDEIESWEASEYYAGVLRKLGFHVHLKVVNADSYSAVIGNRNTPNLDTGWYDWFEDFPHPDDFFRPLLLGSSISRFYNINFAQTNVPSLNSKIEKLSQQPLGRARERQYAALDRRYMKLAPWAPYGTLTLPSLVAKRVDLSKIVWNPTFGADLASFQLK